MSVYSEDALLQIAKAAYPAASGVADAIEALLLAKQAAEASLKASEAERDRLREALQPFAAIKPSTLYADDGSEAETYAVVLKAQYYANPRAFTGTDLARARQALALSVGSGNKDEGVASEAQSGAGTLPGPTSTPSQAGEGVEPAGLTNLRTNQRQLDQDGVTVGVSRQALDETFAFIDTLRAEVESLRRALR